jgi:uncharacterized protein (TIGR02391 family)
MARKQSEPPPLESREFRTPEEIDAGIAKLRRRIEQLEKVDIAKSYLQNTGEHDAAQSAVQATIREVFGANSPEFHEHQHINLWHNASMIMSESHAVHMLEEGRTWMIGILNGLIRRLDEKRSDIVGGTASGLAPATYFDRLNLHPRIRDVARERFMDGYPWDAVFAASKALINYVKERSNRHDLDGAPLMTTVFSKNDPILAFNDLADKTDSDEQEGMMHLFVGAVLAIRNPGGHSFPEGSEQRAVEYISLLSLLAYRLQDAKRRK